MTLSCSGSRPPLLTVARYPIFVAQGLGIPAISNIISLKAETDSLVAVSQKKRPYSDLPDFVAGCLSHWKLQTDLSACANPARKNWPCPKKRHSVIHFLWKSSPLISPNILSETCQSVLRFSIIIWNPRKPQTKF